MTTDIFAVRRYLAATIDRTNREEAKPVPRCLSCQRTHGHARGCPADDDATGFPYTDDDQ